MKCVVVSTHGGLDVLRFEERPEPEPRPDEVLIELRAAALNHLDIWVRTGVPGHTFPLPLIPGSDGAGVVIRAGALVEGVKPGDRVAIAPGFGCNNCLDCAHGRHALCRRYGIFGETRDGTNAEIIAIPAVNALPMPSQLSFEEAAAAPLVFLTAWHMLVDRCRIRPGDDVVVHAAGSGVGTAAIQIARLFGASVIATAGNDAKLELARRCGADHAINYTAGPFGPKVMQITGRRGADIIVDHVGEATIGESLRCLARGGRVVTCGATSGPTLSADLRLIFFKGLSILGSTMGGLGEMREVWSHIAAGRLRPVIDRRFPLADVREAHRHMESRAGFGKIILAMGDAA